MESMIPAFAEATEGKQKREPETEVGIPEWCHRHGSRMRVYQFYKLSSMLVLAGGAAQVKIIRCPQSIRKIGWLVSWEIRFSQDEKAIGYKIFSTDELAGAFGLIGFFEKHAMTLIIRYGAESAQPGKFIRKGVFLNIPCPGTGQDGDPNVSIRLNDEIKNVVKQLVDSVLKG